MPDARVTCPTSQELAAYALGKLPDDRLAAVEDHVGGCEACRAAASDLPPDSFIGRLREAAPGRGTLTPRPAPSLSASGSVPPGRRAGVPGEAAVPAALAGSSKFEVLGRLGRGGMGTVFKARRSLLQDVVAIKVLSRDLVGQAEARERFKREIQAVVQLKHRNVVQAYDAEEANGELFLVMEYVEGVSLERLVGAKGPLPVASAVRCVVQAAEGLQAAHEKGMVHRDIKPANLMLAAKDGLVKVLDFGLARAAKGGAEGNRTRVQTFMGTPDYVAPEQATDARSADIRADVYSLGCTLYFLLAGRPPFQSDTAMNTIVAHIQDPPPPLRELRPEVPDGLWAVVERMLAKRPADRYATPREAAEALRPFATPCPKARGGAGSFVGPAEVRPAPPGTAERPSQAVASPRDRAAPRRRRRAAGAGGWKKWLAYGSAVALSLVTTLALALVVLRVRTAEGIVEVEIDQSDAEVFVDGRKVEVGVKGEREPIAVRVQEGLHELKVAKGGFETATRQFSYSRGEKVVLRVRMVPGKPATTKPDLDLSAIKPMQSIKFDKDDPETDKRGHGPKGGHHVIRMTTPGCWGYNLAALPAEFAIEAVGRARGGPHGAWGLTLTSWPKVPSHGVQIRMTARGQLYVERSMFDGGNWEAPKVGPITGPAIKTGEAYNTVLVVYRHRALEVYVNGKAVTEPVPLERDIGGGTLALCGFMTAEKKDATVAEQKQVTVWSGAGLPPPGMKVCAAGAATVGNKARAGGPFKPLFNGKDLDGWKLMGAKTTRISVTDGVLTAENNGPPGYVDDLVTARRDFENFHLRYQVKPDSRDKPAGVSFRVDPSPIVFGGMRGYQVGLNGPKGGGNDSAGSANLSIVSRVRRKHELISRPVANLRNGTWHTVELIVVNDQARVLVDGKQVVDHSDEGRAFLRGAIALSFLPGTKWEYRNVEIKELPSTPEKGPTGDPRRRWAHQAVVGNEWNERWVVFQQGAGKKWVETNTDHPGGAARFEFTEVIRTGEYVELERDAGAGSTIVVRIYKDHVGIGPDRNRMSRLYEGKWQGPGLEQGK